MKLDVRNVRCLTHATLDLAPITLIAGQRYSGKSTLCLSLGLALTGDWKAVAGSKSTFKTMMLSEGAKGGAIELGDEGGGWRVKLPDAERIQVGDEAPTASLAACGLERFTALSPKERAATFIRTFKAVPTLEEIRKAFAQADADVAGEGAIDLLKKEGWDAATKHYQDEATGEKRLWREVTGENWGSDKGSSWKPDGVDEDASEANLVGKVGDLRKIVVELHQTIGKSEGQHELIAASAEKLEPAEKELALAEEAFAPAKAKLEAVRARIAALPPVQCLRDCPECGVEIAIVGDQLEKSAGGSSKDDVERQGLLKEERSAKASHDGALARVESARRSLERAQKAKAKLAEAGDAPKDYSGELAEAEAAVRDAEAVYAGWRAWQKAASSHQRIVAAIAIAQILGPEGVRKTKAAEVLHLVNGRLEELSEAAGWPVVKITPDFDLSRGGRPYVALSGSERWMADALMQLVQAGADGSDLVVMDEDGQLDGRDRGKLMRAVRKAGKQTVLAMMLSKVETAPDLSRSGGVTYVLEGGAVRRLGREQVREAA